MFFIKEIIVLLYNEIDDIKYRLNGINFCNKVGLRYIIIIFMIRIEINVVNQLVYLYFNFKIMLMEQCVCFFFFN